jgi:hypothetical protein
MRRAAADFARFRLRSDDVDAAGGISLLGE